jgi:acetyl-CoA carboxylase alpha subunit
MLQRVAAALGESLDSLSTLSPDALRAQRRQKYKRMAQAGS